MRNKNKGVLSFGLEKDLTDYFLMEVSETIARIAHQVNKAYCESIGDTSQANWEDAPEWQKQSAIDGVKYHLSCPNATPEDSHANWLNVKLNDGWVYGPVKDAEKKTHPCIMPYSELPQEQRSKDYIFRAVVHAMAADTH